MVQTSFGGPDVVRLQSVREPDPLPGQAVVRVAACSLNRLDVLQRRGPGVIPGFGLPHIAGMDVAGTVAAVGAGVTAIAPGDPVVLDPAQGCGSCFRCLSGNPGHCSSLRIVGGNTAGGLAEYVAAEAAGMFAVPPDVPLGDAAALPVACATAWHALHTVGQIAAGEYLVVQAAASTVSLAVIQFAKRAGARVIAVASTGGKLAAAQAAGADHGLRNDCDLPSFVLEVTQGRGADIVVDHVGARTWAASLASLGINGRLVMLGNTSGDQVGFSLADVFHRGIRLLGTGAYTQCDFTAALTACFEGGLRLPVAAQFGLDDLPAAWAVLEDRATAGKVVIRP